MVEQKNIFLGDDDALVYLVKPVQQKIFHKIILGAIHLARTNLMTDFSTSFAL